VRGPTASGAGGDCWSALSRRAHVAAGTGAVAMSSTAGRAACPPGRLPAVVSTLPQMARWGYGEDESSPDSLGPGRAAAAEHCHAWGWPGTSPDHRRKRNVTHQRAGRRSPARRPGRHAARRRPCHSHAGRPIMPPSNVPIGRAKPTRVRRNCMLKGFLSGHRCRPCPVVPGGRAWSRRPARRWHWRATRCRRTLTTAPTHGTRAGVVTVK